MADEPISYLALEDGTEVRTADGTTIGTVEHVLQDDALDFFDGLVISTSAGRRFVDAEQITAITTGAVATALTDDEAAHLPRPDGSALYDADPQQFQSGELSQWFGRMFFREHWMRETGDDPGRR
ncbi:MAG: hypothetical protein HIU86_07280 [Acidobacteria bacterium]|nr:hypothetical protein [Acidobacteriota bacterium]